MRILLTGGAGYIGSHTAVSLIEAGHDVVILDNFNNSNVDAVKHVQTITGTDVPLVIGDIRDPGLLDRVFSHYSIEGVAHLASLKSVGDSIENPILYYNNNIRGAISLIDAMNSNGIKTLVFSSSANVYGEPKYLPVDENHPVGAMNPYGRTKQMIEQIMSDVSASDQDWRIAILRYFNPVGAHRSGLIGEDSPSRPSNLMPYICGVADKRLQKLHIFGDDFDTHDGTGIRDYIHVMDLAAGHVAALSHLLENETKISTWNLGTGRGYSVLDVIRAFESVNGVEIPYEFSERRLGDVAACFASAEKAEVELGWSAVLDISEMCSSSWNFARSLRNRSKTDLTAD